MTMINQTQIFGDGNNLTILMKDCGSNQQIAYKFKQPHLQTLRYNAENKYAEMLGDNVIIKPQSIVTCDIEIKACHENFEVQYGDDLLMNLDMFKNISVSQMFRIINKKLNERNKEE